MNTPKLCDRFKPGGHYKASCEEKQLKSKLDQGLITKSDYEAKKAEVLAKM